MVCRDLDGVLIFVFASGWTNTIKMAASRRSRTTQSIHFQLLGCEKSYDRRSSRNVDISRLGRSVRYNYYYFLNHYSVGILILQSLKACLLSLNTCNQLFVIVMTPETNNIESST
jgi:hypothetical protein